MFSENGYRWLGRYKYLSKNRLREFFARDRTRTEDFGKMLLAFSLAKEDALIYLGISESEFWRLVTKWPIMEEQLFLRKEGVDEFYRSWRGDFAHANICANIFNQFLSFDLYRAIQPYTVQARRIMDVGCGTASVSLAHILNRKSSHAALVLIELQEDIRKFIQYRLDKNGLKRAYVRDVSELGNEQPFDLVLCIDVLEHLENSTEVFIENILPKVEIGGYLILRAPWRGQLTHIDEAPESFYRDGGRKTLSKHFVEVKRIGANDIDAVYKRIK